MNTRRTIFMLAIASCGCLDVNLLDEMQTLEEFDTESSTHTETTNESNGDTEEPAGPPDTDSSDLEAPALSALECGGLERIEERICIAEGPNTASMRFLTDEPAEVTVTTDGHAAIGVLSDPWSHSHHVVMGKLPPLNDTAVSIGLSDINGNRTDIPSSVTAASGPAVSITEILADPFGAEPDQEFVEIANPSDQPVDLSNWMVDDNGDANGDLLPEGTLLGPSEVALLVSPNYDVRAASDPAPHPSAQVIYLDSSLGSNGLKNAGAESIELYDGLGNLVSSYPGQIDSAEGQGTVRVVAEAPNGDWLAFEPDPQGTSTPGTTPML